MTHPWTGPLVHDPEEGSTGWKGSVPLSVAQVFGSAASGTSWSDLFVECGPVACLTDVELFGSFVIGPGKLGTTVTEKLGVDHSYCSK